MAGNMATLYSRLSVQLCSNIPFFVIPSDKGGTNKRSETKALYIAQNIMRIMKNTQIKKTSIKF